MILSNEPGYYREGSFGIRLENLIAVIEAPSEEGRTMLGFETITLCPIDTRCIDRAALSPAEARWLDGYHAQVRETLSPLLDEDTGAWLDRATAPIA